MSPEWEPVPAGLVAEPMTDEDYAELNAWIEAGCPDE